MIRIVGLVFSGVVVGFFAITWFALESGGGVGVVETQRPDRTVRSTHVWPARIDAVLWLEAGTAGNGWYVDAQSKPLVWLDFEDERQRYRAVPVHDPAAHDRLRASIRERFGWRDRWVGIWVDSSASIAVRLDPAFQESAE